MRLNLLVLLISYFSVVVPSLANEKNDILGISIGMPMTQVSQLIQTKGWSCEKGTHILGFLRCHTKEFGDVCLRIAEALPNMPVHWMTMTFSTGEPPNKVIASISQQFGKQPLAVYGADAKWILSNGSELDLQSGGSSDHDLIMFSEALKDANEKAEREQAAARNPMPKF